MPLSPCVLITNLTLILFLLLECSPFYFILYLVLITPNSTQGVLHHTGGRKGVRLHTRKYTISCTFSLVLLFSLSFWYLC